MISLDFEWQTNEFMLYCRTTQLREKSMASYEQALRLFERWCAEELRIFTVDKVTEPVIRKYINDLYFNSERFAAALNYKTPIQYRTELGF